MTDKTNINLSSSSDTAILQILGEFVRNRRLEQNKTQDQLAEQAGISRSTLIEFEQGKRSNTITFIQLLRALDLLNVLEEFKTKRQISPIQLAKLEQKMRKRASGKNNSDNNKKSEW